MAYRYRKLADGKIRLLLLQPGQSGDRIKIRVVHSQLTSSLGDSFEALYYVWRDVDFQEQVNTSSGEVLYVTINLANALRRLRYQDRNR